MQATSKGVRLSNGSNLEVVKFASSKVGCGSLQMDLIEVLYCGPLLTKAAFHAETDNEATTAFRSRIISCRYVPHAVTLCKGRHVFETTPLLLCWQ